MSGANHPRIPLANAAWHRIEEAFRPSTMANHRRHFRTYIAFRIFTGCPVTNHLHIILAFIEYLHQNAISPKVVRNYISSIASQAKFYSIQHQDINHPAVARYLRSISMHSRFQPTPRGIFDVRTLYAIFLSCDHQSDPILFRTIFLCAFYAFPHMSNVAPHSTAQFDADKHFLRQDVIFAPPGAHLIIKWTKTLQDNKSHHVVQLPTINNIYLCPVRALKALLKSTKLPPTHPLFATHTPPFNQILIHILGKPSKLFCLSDIFHTPAMVSTLSGGLGRPWRLTIVSHFKTSRTTAFGGVQLCGPTYRMLHTLHPSSLPLLPLSFPLSCSWGLVL